MEYPQLVYTEFLIPDETRHLHLEMETCFFETLIYGLWIGLV